jgi:hypothetical protein
MILSEAAEHWHANYERCLSLHQAVQVLERYGLDLGSQAVVNRYPVSARYICYGEHRGTVFSYDFLSSEGRNIATFIPDLASLQIQPGCDGHGRVWGLPMPEVMNINNLKTPA